MVRAKPVETTRRRTFFRSPIPNQRKPSSSASTTPRATRSIVPASTFLSEDDPLKTAEKAPANGVETKSGHFIDASGGRLTSGSDASRNASNSRKVKCGSDSIKTLATGTKRPQPAKDETRSDISNVSRSLGGEVNTTTSFWKTRQRTSSASTTRTRNRQPVSAVSTSVNDGGGTQRLHADATSGEALGQPMPPARAKSSTSSALSSKGDMSNKRYMEAGFYCQDDLAKSPHKLVSKVLLRREAEDKMKKRKGKALFPPDLNRPAFPPLPYDYGHDLFFGEQHDFVIPFNIQREAENGLLDGKKKPAAYAKLRANAFPERNRVLAPVHAVCRCAPESGCGDNCINRIMSYLCGRDCPCGDSCTNKSLAKRKPPSVKISYTGSRGFGLVAQEDIKEGDFVIDYRGEIIALETYQERCQAEYAASRNFYALAYDQDEVIDAGARGNEARFINHSCNPNLVVHRFQSLGDGQEEYEVGMWASRDIVAGQELSYDYNFDDFGVAEGSKRVECRCGAPNCVGFLGRRSGEKSAKQIALDIEAEKAAREKVAEIKAKRADRKLAKASSSTKPSKDPCLSESAARAPKRVPPYRDADSEGKSRACKDEKPSKPIKVSTSKPPHAIEPPVQPIVGILIGGRPIVAKIAETLTERPANRKRTSHVLVRPASSGKSISPPKNKTKGSTARGGRHSMPAPATTAKSSRTSGKKRNSSEALPAIGISALTSPTPDHDREPSPVPLFVPLKKARKSTPSTSQAGPSKRSVSIKSRASEPAPSINQKENADSAMSADAAAQQKAAREARIRAKQEAIKARNGAPRGWAYVAVPAAPPPVQPVDEVEQDLPRSSRRRSIINYHEP